MRSFENKKRIVIKIGSSSLFYTETKKMNFSKIEKLVRIITDLKNQGKDVILVSSGAIATGKNLMKLDDKELTLPLRQACASIGQAQLITVYQKLFMEYNQTTSQVLITRYTFHSKHTRENTVNTFNGLFKLNAIPIVNENDTVTTEEIEFGDNDCLSALVAKLVGADLLIILSDIDGFYSDDPRKNPEAKLINKVESITGDIINMGKKTTGTRYGSGGMASKIEAGLIACGSGIDMVITNSDDLDNLTSILEGQEIGTHFTAGGAPDYEFSEFDIND